jgi:hypothetical protein
LKPVWWGAADEGDHFTVYVLGGRFLARDRLIRANLKPDKMSADQIAGAVRAEASQLALAHGRAWGKAKKGAIRDWLSASAPTIAGRWRAAYSAAGGK